MGINCSQTKFVAFILDLSVFVYAIFSLERFFVWRFWLFVLKNGINRQRLAGIKCSQSLSPLFQLKLFWRLILMVWKAVLRGWRPLHCWPPPPTIAPTRPKRAVTSPPHCCPTPHALVSPRYKPPPPFPATDEQPLAKTRKLILFCTIFFKLFENVWNFFILISLRCQETSFRVLIIGYCIISNDDGMVSTF